MPTLQCSGQLVLVGLRDRGGLRTLLVNTMTVTVQIGMLVDQCLDVLSLPNLAGSIQLAVECCVVKKL